MNIAITGSKGLLGSTLIKSSTARNMQSFGVPREELDPARSLKEITEYFKLKEVNVIIHCAANTNVELCETQYDQCYFDNVILTELLANVCTLLDIKLVFISSTGIYGEAQNEPYNEYSDVHPTTVHHWSKWHAESNLAAILNNHLIIRTGWLFGGDWDMPKNFVANRIKEAKSSSGCISSDVSQKGCPTYVNDVAGIIFDLIGSEWCGTFNCVNKGFATRFEYVAEIVKLSGLDIEVKPVSGVSFNRVAKVSSNETAVNMKLEHIGFEDLPTWKSSLKLYISELKRNKFF